MPSSGDPGTIEGHCALDKWLWIAPKGTTVLEVVLHKKVC